MNIFVNKVISLEYADEIRRLIHMTKVGRLFEEEKKNYATNYAQSRQKNGSDND